MISSPIHDAAVALSASRGEVFCSGVILTPKVVLTAAHCVWRNGIVKTPFAVVSGKDVRFGGTYARVQSAVVHPAYEGFFGGPDVAVLVLAEPVASSSVGLELSEVDIRPGDDIAFIGFGETGDNPLGLRHTGTASITRVDGQFFSYEPSTCFGDSGGPIIVATPSGPQIVGVVSSANLLCREASATRIAGITEWIHRTAN
ncbi:MAG: trypsin-like serine protease, partial [Myxococcota bacterium]